MQKSPSTDFVYDVFISYSTRDRDWVRDWLLPHLEGVGLRACIDYRDFAVGQPGLTNMEAGIAQSRAVLLVLTPSWLESEWTGFESLLVQTDDPTGLRGRILPLMLERCTPPKRIGIFTYADFTQLEQREAEFQRILAALKQPGEAVGAQDHAANPFIWRQGITDADGFFNRDNEQRTLRNYLRNRQNCQIVGARRIGKTSLLRQVERVASTWERTALVACLDLQDARCFTLSGWLSRAARQFGWSTPPQTLAEFADCVEDTLSAGRRPVLCLDEFEELTARRAEFPRDFFVSLRACGQQGMSIVTTSQKLLSQLTDPGDPTSPFFNTFAVLRLGPFSRADAEDFVTLERPGVTPFTPEEKVEILHFANGHQLALQVACFYVVEAKENGDDLTVALRNATDEMRALLPKW